MTGYEVKITECSKELTARERISIKDLSKATPIDTAVDDATLIIYPKDYAVLAVHNEHSKNDKDYEKFVIIDTNGNKFITGSKSFWTAFMDIFVTMREEAPNEEYGIEIYKMPSRNYNGKSFITCSIVP